MFVKTLGNVVQLLDTSYGKTRAGKDFERREYLLEVNGGTQYVHSVKFSMLSFDGLIQNPLEVGQYINASLKIVAQQFNGKWYNDITLTAWEPA